MTRFAPAIILLASIGLAACSQKTQDDAANTADGAVVDVGATTRNAIEDVDVASDRALDSAQNSIDQASPGFNRAMEKAGNAADRAQAKTGQALKDAGNAIER